MLTISLVGQKGGGGKSTCCWILAQAVLARPGNLKVLLIETDSQGSTIGFVSAALTNYPDMAERLFCERATTADEVYELIEQAEENGIDYVIVDTEGRHSNGEWPGREAGLTAREAEVLALITQGLSNQEIAERSYLSINSVKTYIRTAYRKVGVTRRAQAVVWGMQHGLAPDRTRRVDGTVAG